MAASITLDPWCIGDDETVAVYIYSDAAATTPVDVTGRTYTLSVATARGATPVLALTGTVTGASGLVTFTATDTQTTALTAGTYVFDVVEVSGSNESTIILGTVAVGERVTA